MYLSAKASGGDRLICALAAKECLESRTGNGFSRGRDAHGSRNQIKIDAANNHDVLALARHEASKESKVYRSCGPNELT